MAMNMDAILNLRANVQGANKIVELNRGLMAMEGTAKGVTGAMRGMTGAAAGLSGALGALTPLMSVAGLVGLAKGALDAGDKMHDLAQSTGVSVESLAKFKKAAATSGTDIDSVAKALVKLSKTMLEASVGGKQQAATFKALGIDVKDSSGQLKSADAVMLEVADRFKQMPDGVAKTALSLKLFGRAGAEMIPLLDMGGAAIDKLSVKMTSAFADKADAYKDKLAMLSGKVGALGADLLILLLPALDKITDAVSGAVSAFNGLSEPIKNFAMSSAALAIVWGPLTSVIRGAVGVFALLTTAETSAGAAAAASVPGYTAASGAMSGAAVAAGRLVAVLSRLAAIGIVTVGVNYISNVVGAAMSLRQLQDRDQRGGAAADFAGATRQQVLEAQAKQRINLANLQKQDEQRRRNLASNPFSGVAALFGAAPFMTAEQQSIGYKAKYAQAVLGLDPNKFRNAATNGGGFNPELSALQSGGGGGSGAASGKAAADAKRLAEERAKQLLDSQKQLAISEAELRISQAQNPLDKAAAEYALQKLRIEQDYSSKFADVKSLQERSNYEAAKRNELEKLRLAYLEQQTAELLRQAGIDNSSFGKNPTGIEWKDAVQFKPGAGFQSKTDDAIGKIKERLQELTDPANQVIGTANAIGDAFANTFEGMISGSMTAKQALASFFQSIANYFTKMATQMIADAIRMMAIKLLTNLVGSLFGGFGGGGMDLGKNFSSAGAGSTGISWSSAIGYKPSANGNVFAANGIVPYAMGGIVDRPTLFPFAKGIGQMGEAGPEAILPLQRGANGKLGVASGGGSTTINVSVDAKGSNVEGDGGKGNQLARVIAAAVQQEMIKQKRPGGILAS